MRNLVAGLCIAGILLPEAVAYAGLAHMPVASALTGTLVGLALYGLFGGSRFAIVAPTSSTASLCAAAAISLVVPMGAAGGNLGYSQVLVAMVVASGVMLVLLAAMRQGQLSSFVSRPVLRGFAFALALTIVIKQLPDALGMELTPDGSRDPAHLLWFALTHIDTWHGPTMAVAAGASICMLLLKRWPHLPASLITMVLALVAAKTLPLQTWGVHEIGTFERPALQLALPDLSLDQWLRVFEVSFGLVMLVFAESWGSMRSAALQVGDRLNPNRELAVLGLCNLGSGLFQGMAVGAGFSATAANAGAGAQSRWAGIVALFAMGAALIWALPVLHYLPRPVLAVAVVFALWHALSPKPILALWAIQRDQLLIVAAVLAVIFLGVLDGLLAAIGLSLLATLQRFSQPVVHELGALGNTRNYVEIAVQQGAKAVPHILILRPEEPLFFGSAERVANEVLDRAKARTDLQAVVLSLEESADLDSTALECLLELDHSLRNTETQLVLARVKTTVRSLLARSDAQGLGSNDRMFWSVDDAVKSVTVTG
ncbi:putative sulfate transporter [Comamonadaceae bacterium OS-4]|nr:putative sulfate transporter [Comamonadaceae bacterium OS-4]